MKIANIMLGAGRGGVEQALVDSSEALTRAGHHVTAFVRRGAAITAALNGAQIPHVALHTTARWNLLARAQFLRRLRDFDLVLLHGNRAAQMTRGLRHTPVVAVAHSRFFKRLPHLSAVIALSADRAHALNTPYIVPNLVRLPPITPRAAFRTPPVIGALGRLSPEKGMDIFVDALHLLRTQGIMFKAVLGGTGSEEAALTDRIRAYGLAEDITLAGWVNNTHAFFENIDLFVLPSRTENFPITLIEAMAHGCPIVATRCGGTERVMKVGAHGVPCEIDPTAMAEALGWALSNPAAMLAMGHEACAYTEAHYALDVVGKKLSTIAEEIVASTARSAA